MKKKFYAIGSLIAIIGPTLAVVSCDESDGKTGNGNDADNNSLAKIKSAELYTHQNTLYVTYEEEDKELDSIVALKFDNSIAKDIANFVLSFLNKKEFDTIMIKIKGKTKSDQNEKEYYMEVDVAKSDDLPKIQKSIIDAWDPNKKVDPTANKAPKDSSWIKDVAPGAIWGNNISPGVTSSLSTWDTSKLVTWQGGMTENLATNNVTSLGGKTGITEELTLSDITNIEKNLFTANYDVLNQDHQSTLLTILWYYKIKGSPMTQDNAIAIHKAFVDAWTNSFTKAQDDLDPVTFLSGIRAVEEGLWEFITNKVAFTKENLLT